MSERVQNQIKDNPANPYRMSSDKGLYDHFNIIFDFSASSSLAPVRSAVRDWLRHVFLRPLERARMLDGDLVGKWEIIGEAMRVAGRLKTLQRLTPALHTPQAKST